MSTGRSYALLAGQLVLLVAGVVAAALVVHALGGPPPLVGLVAGPVGAAVVVAFLARRRVAGAGGDAALDACPVRIPLDRWPVGGIWQNKYRATTRAGWAPGVLGLAPGTAVFVPSRAKEADRRWQDFVRGVQLRSALMGSATAVRVHGRAGTAQFLAQHHPKQVRAAVEQVLPVSEGWDETMPEPPQEPPVPGQRPWPQQYSVRLVLDDGTETRIEVGTWQERAAAERIARRAHAHVAPRGPGVREAAVVDRGPVPRRPDGMPDLSELAVDRQEF